MAKFILQTAFVMLVTLAAVHAVVVVVVGRRRREGTYLATVAIATSN